MLMQRMASYSVETRQGKYHRLTIIALLLLIVLYISITGCGTGRSSLQLKIARSLKQSDSLLVYDFGSDGRKRVKRLKLKAIRKSKEFQKIAEALSLANPSGTVIRTSSDHTIVLLESDQTLLEMEYCSIDGRLTDINDDKSDVLFVPAEKRSVFDKPKL